jgi:nickel transport protein
MPIIIIFICISIVSFSFAHSIQYEIKNEKAVVIKIYFPDGTPFSYEEFKIYSPNNNKIPYQIGRTDKYGRIIFIPDRPGDWIIKSFSEDGHGILKKIHISNLNKVSEEKSSLDYFLKVVIGLLLIFLLYFFLYILFRRKNN